MATRVWRIACSAKLKPVDADVDADGVVCLEPHRLPNLGFAGAVFESVPSSFPFDGSDEFQRVADNCKVRRSVRDVRVGVR